MEESTQGRTAEGTPSIGGYCSWHQRFSDDVRLIRLSSGDTHYACVHCVRIFKLTPSEDQ
ncbi:hypothetical protein [Streptomyces flaveolus]|uniref:hypothetical protein n=1 Tax=Streptomyces flaveolus TaxID=67297 RepID=UPI00166FA6F3|nr:hypothetical protein [Streptomyces flaveolus]GGQ81453.1 hypothetical protein GCM10010216_49140 [Streptomyces flaveolus]